MRPDGIGTVLASGQAPAGNSSAILSAVLTIAILVLILRTRIRGRPLAPARLLVLPSVLVVVGLGSVVPQLGTTHLHTIDDVVIAVDVLLSVALGTARGFTVLVYPKDGATWYRYGRVTVMLWFLSIALRIVLAAVTTPLGASTLVTSTSLLSMLGLTLLIQNAIVLGRTRPGLTANPASISTR